MNRPHEDEARHGSNRHRPSKRSPIILFPASSSVPILTAPQPRPPAEEQILSGIESIEWEGFICAYRTVLSLVEILFLFE